VHTWFKERCRCAMDHSSVGQRERYNDEWNGWKAEATAFDGVRRHDQISRVVQQLGARKILDVGCGDGRLGRAIRARCSNVIIHGCDLSTAALTRSDGLDRQYSVDLNYEALQEPDESFDLVIASEVIEHLIMPDRVLEELTRVLMQGGHVLLTVPNVAFWRFRVQALNGQVPSVTADDRHLHSFSASLLGHLVRRAGLNVVQLTGLRQRFNRLSQLHFQLLSDTLLIVGRKP
jgi:2-polyprenyl-3-methyl-5-hydroxy-6-metoxy-1,4-benzoquinol methylase